MLNVVEWARFALTGAIMASAAHLAMAGGSSAGAAASGGGGAGNSGAGGGSSNAAAVSANGGLTVGLKSLSDYGKIISIVRYALDLPLKSGLTQIAGYSTGLITTLGSFAVKVTLDDDARKAVLEVIEIHEANTAGLRTGSAGTYARSAGFSDAEIADLFGLEPPK